MEVLAEVGGSVLSGIILSVIKRVHANVIYNRESFQSEFIDALRDLEDTLSTVKELVSDADKRAYIDNDKQVRGWLERLQEATYDADKILDELEYKQLKRLHAESKLANYYHRHSPFHLFESDVIRKINDIKKRITRIFENAKTYKLLKSGTDGANSERRVPTSSTNNTIDVFGRDAIRDEIIELLTQESPIIYGAHDMTLSAKKVPVFAIIGLGGIGKTTLAQMVINHEKIQEYFDLKIWVCVSNDFDEKNIIKQILESIYYSKRKCIGKGENMKINSGNTTMENYENFDILTRTLGDEIKGQRFLIILDDIWNEDSTKWQNVENCLKIDEENMGSRILITTRSKLVANIMPSSVPIYLDGLHDDVFWPLFKQCALGTIDEHPPELEEIGKEIMRKLKGSPLAAKTVGRILKANPSKRHWETILNSEMWRLTQEKSGIMQALRLSYHYLPEYLKPCFAFCSLYPKDYIYEKRQIVHMWIALDYIENKDRDVPMEEIGEEYVNELLDRSIFQSCTVNDLSGGDLQKFVDAKEMFKIHDLIHDLSKIVSANESLMIQNDDALKHVSPSTRNISIFVNETWSWAGPRNFFQFNHIRTLIILSKKKMTRERDFDYAYPLRLFVHNLGIKTKFLRVLDLSYIFFLWPLPKLKHLRYLDLHNTGFAKLPSSFENLYQLQFVKCDELKSRPQIKFMKHLRHIRGFGVDTNVIENLENFHFLQEVELDVSEQHRFSSTRNKMNRLKVLRAMKWMRELSIHNLQNVESKDEALEAGLKNMDGLTKLTLSWDFNAKGNNSDEILEALHPGPNVVVLEFVRYPGVEFPNWMENLSFLREIKVNRCSNAKFIRTTELKTVKQVEFSFCEHLGIQDGTEGFNALTCLERLEIADCPRLMADLFMEGRGGLPSSLKEIRLKNTGDIVINVSSTILQSLTNLARLVVGSYGDGSIIPSPTNSQETQKLQQLSEFVLDYGSTQELKAWLLHLRGCISLAVITISFCERLEYFDTEMEDALVSFASLREICLLCLPLYRSLPTRLCEFSSLKELTLRGCPKLDALPERGLPAGLRVLHVSMCYWLSEHLENVRHELPDGLRVGQGKGWYSDFFSFLSLPIQREEFLS